MRIEDASILVGSVRGAAASMLLLMALTRNEKVVWEVEELRIGTKYSRSQVLAGRQELIKKRLASTIGARYGLMLTDYAVQQLRLPLKELAEASGMVTQEWPTQANHADQPTQANTTGGLREVFQEDLEVYRGDLAQTTDDVVVDQISDLDLDQISDLDQHHHQQQQGGARSTGATSRKPDKPSETKRAVLQACVEAGIGYPTNRDLAGREWVTVDRIRRAIRQVGLENREHPGRWRNPIGQAIMRLQDELEPMADDQLEAWAVRLEPRSEPESESPDVDQKPRADLPPASREARMYWQAALGELQLQMTKPTFETYVKRAEVIAFDAGAGKFTVAAPDEFVRDWLESKLLSSIKRALCGIVGQLVDVEFVVRRE